MARVTGDGIVPLSLAEWIAEFADAWTEAIGVNLDTSTESVAGQVIGTNAFKMVQADEALASHQRLFSVALATGRDLDDLASFAQITRRIATQSSVTVTVSGVSGTVIPVGSRIASTNSNVFYINETVTIPSAGSLTVEARSTEFGAIPAPANSITAIINSVLGWDTVNNTTAATLGTPVESDDSLRSRLRARQGINSRAFDFSIKAAVGQIEGVIDLEVYNNRTNAVVDTQGLSIAAHSIAVIVEGGTDNAIAEAIRDYSDGGVGFSGGVSVTLSGVDPGPFRFSRVEEVPMEIRINTTTRPDFPSNGLSTMSTNLVNYVNVLDIGEPLPTNDLYLPLLQVPNHIVTSISVIRKNGYVMLGTGTISDLADIQAITAGTFTFTVDSNAVNATAIDFSGITSIGGAASVLQVRIRAVGGDVSLATVSYVNGTFRVSVPPSAGTARVISGVGSGTVAGVLGLDSTNIYGTVADTNNVYLTERLTLDAEDITITAT